MKNKYVNFDSIIGSYYNGNHNYAKKEIKKLKRSERYDLILFSKESFSDSQFTSFAIRVCVTGDFS